MDEEQKEQITCAIYMSIYNQNYRCAQTILDEVIIQATNNTLDQVIEIIEHSDSSLLLDIISELRQD